MRGPGGRPGRRPGRAAAFRRAVHRLVSAIPAGRVATYGQIAALLGAPRAARAVGAAMRHCPDAVPWHRVVNARGAISPRASVAGMLTQGILLQHEGVPVRGGRLALSRYRWVGPRGARRLGREPRCVSV